jgi:hypothetical protein
MSNEMIKALAALKMAHADALWYWAQIEASLFGIYASALGLQTLRQYEAIQQSFFAAISFEVRLAMTHAAAKTIWPERHKHLTAWLTIYEDCKKAARQRGKIAHLSGGIWTPDTAKDSDAVVLAQAFGHPKFPRYATAKSEGITREALESYAESWGTLLERMNEFSLELVNEPQPSALREPADYQGPRPPYQGGLTPKGRE